MLQYGTGGGNYFEANLLGGEAVYYIFFVEEIPILTEGAQESL